MIQKIILVRHGESADKQVGQTDFERVLTDRGKISIQQLGRFLKQENIFPDSIFASTAVRTQQTAEILAAEIGKKEIENVASLYNGTDSEYLNILSQTAGTVLIVGHNPAISFVAGKLCTDYSICFAPGQAAIIEISTDHSKNLFGRLLKLVGPLNK